MRKGLNSYTNWNQDQMQVTRLRNVQIENHLFVVNAKKRYVGKEK